MIAREGMEVTFSFEWWVRGGIGDWRSGCVGCSGVSVAYASDVSLKLSFVRRPHGWRVVDHAPCSERRFFLRPERVVAQVFTYVLAYAAAKTGIQHWVGGQPEGTAGSVVNRRGLRGDGYRCNGEVADRGGGGRADVSGARPGQPGGGGEPGQRRRRSAPRRQARSTLAHRERGLAGARAR